MGLEHWLASLTLRLSFGQQTCFHCKIVGPLWRTCRERMMLSVSQSSCLSSFDQDPPKFMPKTLKHAHLLRNLTRELLGKPWAIKRPEKGIMHVKMDSNLTAVTHFSFPSCLDILRSSQLKKETFPWRHSRRSARAQTCACAASYPGLSAWLRAGVAAGSVSGYPWESNTRWRRRRISNSGAKGMHEDQPRSPTSSSCRKNEFSRVPAPSGLFSWLSVLATALICLMNKAQAVLHRACVRTWGHLVTKHSVKTSSSKSARVFILEDPSSCDEKLLVFVSRRQQFKLKFVGLDCEWAAAKATEMRRLRCSS